MTTPYLHIDLTPKCQLAMSTTHASLTSAADERKARLAKLASLKRKQPGSDTTVSQQPQPPQDEPPPPPPDPSPPQSLHLSGRNYDPTTRAPRLGFDHSTTLLSSNNNPTLETQSNTLLQTTLATAASQEAELKQKEASGSGGGIDLFRLQPKKPNWDLKREWEERRRKWDVDGKTRAAVAKMVRERIETRKREALEAKAKEREEIDGGRGREQRSDEEEAEGAEEVGIEGAELVEGLHQREREEEEEERRERELEGDLEGEGEGVP